VRNLPKVESTLTEEPGQVSVSPKNRAKNAWLRSARRSRGYGLCADENVQRIPIRLAKALHCQCCCRRTTVSGLGPPRTNASSQKRRAVKILFQATKSANRGSTHSMYANSARELFSFL